jgi:ABC-type transport system substrate-binding protein
MIWRRRVRLVEGIIVVVAGTVLAAACSRASGSDNAAPPGTGVAAIASTVIPANEGTPQPGGAMVLGIDAEPSGFNPVQNQYATNNMIVASSIFETLTVFDKDQKVQPYLADSLTPSNLASKWTIKLKPNIKFSDGTPFDAAAVKANIDAFKAGLSSIVLKVVDSVNVVDDLTVEVDMSQPWASFPSFLASEEGFMEAPNAINAPDAMSHPVGTGPFVLDKWDHGTSIVVKKNPNYWQSGKPYLDQIDFRVLNDPAARVNALESGQINMMFSDDPQTIATYRNKAGFKDVIDATGDAQSIVMNQAAPPFDNINARKALVHATDDKAITDTTGDGVLNPIDQPFSDKNPYHTTDSHYGGFDLDAAKRDVAQYTAETGQPLEFTLTSFAGSSNLALGQLLQEQWSKAGIKTQISTVDQTTGISEIIFGKTQAVLNPNFGYPDPDWTYVYWHSDFTAPVGQISVNFGHLKLPDLDQALVQGRVNLVPDQRKAAYSKVTQLLNDNYAYVWIYRYVAALVAADNVHGLGQAEQAGFATIVAKPYFQDLWMKQS